MRTLVDIPDDQIHALASLSERAQQSRAALIRDAIAEYLARHRPADTGAAFGLWGPNTEDGVAYQDRLRAEW